MDHYILDFITDWLTVASTQTRDNLRACKEEWRDALAQSYRTSLPADILRVAERGDCEPRETPFHASAHAKYTCLTNAAASHRYLGQCRLAGLRTEALVAMHTLPDSAGDAPEGDKTATTPDALTLRSGWEREDTVVTMAAPRANAGHVHSDGGSLMLGRSDAWFICDPGYQQYLDTSERPFTIGPTAHNAPLVNGVAQSRKQSQRLACRRVDRTLLQAAVDLTACYEDIPNLETGFELTRTIWLIESTLLVVADRFAGAGMAQLSYCWHGDPAAAWGFEDGQAVLQQPDQPALWMQCPRATLAPPQLSRLRGSRGHLALSVHVPVRNHGCCWWLMQWGEKPDGLDTGEEDGYASLAGHQLTPLASQHVRET